ncbi:MAG: hypothetical protein ACYTAN_14115 [Planctomycetota bacterium]|jgi:hypothetical protein
MKGRYCWLVLAALLTVVLSVGVVARAAESGDAGSDKPKAEKEGGAAKPTLEQRLKNLQVALDKFCERHFGNIPRTIDALVEYLAEKEKGLINPETNKKIVMNEKMAGKSSPSIKKPSEFVTFYADKPTPGKGRATVFGDGKVKYLDEKTFARKLAASIATRLQLESTDREAMRERRGSRRRGPRK